MQLTTFLFHFKLNNQWKFNGFPNCNWISMEKQKIIRKTNVNVGNHECRGLDGYSTCYVN